jgi:hypothetical protein
MAVSLASNNNLLPVPAPSVLVPANATSAVFSATAGNIAANQGATLSATLSGASQTVAINLVAAPPVMLSSLVCSPTSLATGAATSCIVTLSKAAPNGGTVVGLASNNTLLPVPAASVTVPANATSTTFTVTAGQIQEPQLANLTVTLSRGSIQFGVNLLTQVIPLSLTCTPRMLWSGGTTVCTVTLSQAAPVGVTWSLSPATGTLSTGGGVAVYAAPAIISSAQTVNITATSMADPTKSVTSVVTLVPAIIISLAPSSVNLQQGQTQQFTTTVTGTTNQAVNWSLSPTVGTIDSTGLYTAPASVMSSQNVTVTAQSTANTTATASSTVTLRPTGIAYSVGPNGLTSLTYNGVDYTWPIGFVVYEFWTPRNGTETTAWVASQVVNTVVGTNPSSVTQNYQTDPIHPWNLRFEYRGAGTNTLQIDIYATNRAQSDVLRPYFTPLSWHLPQPISSPPIGIDQAYSWLLPYQPPNGFQQFGTQSVAWWNTPSNSNIQSYTVHSSDRQSYKVEFQTMLTNGPVTYREQVQPGQQKHWTLYFRFGGSSQTTFTLPPEAYTSYAATFPFITPLKDRRPMGRVMISNPNTNRANCTAQNPRCYGMNFTNVLGDPAGFLAAALAYANQTVSVLNGMTNRPQGVIIWDLEGQEFLQPFSYVGDPAHISVLAPEMDTIADEFIAVFTNAGYKVGLTLRPHHFLYGTTLPPTCTANATPALRDVFILTTATWPYRGYTCNATNVWTQEGAFYPATQTDALSYTDLYNTLSAKVQYAQTRWGTTFFYVDSNGWASDGQVIGPQVWRDLVAAFPNVTFFQEHRSYGSYGAASNYNDPSVQSVRETEPVPAQIWQGLSFLMTVNGGTFGSNLGTVIDGVRKGDMLIFDSWWQTPGVASTDSIYGNALSMNSSVTVNGRSFSTTLTNPSDPSPPACNPTKFRVVYAPTAGSISSSNTFCWSTGNCTLDLTGMAVYQIQRANYNNDICSVDSILPLP